MSGAFVLDASMTLSWAFADEATPFTVHVLKTLETVQSVAPALWPFEVASVLAVAERRGRISASQQIEFLEKLRLLPIIIEHRPAAWLGQQILSVARAYRSAPMMPLISNWPCVKVCRWRHSTTI